MQNTLVFNQFDAVVSMTEATINDQLVHLLRMGVIKPSLIIVQEIQDDNYVYQVLNDGGTIPANCAYINGQILPRVLITESGSNITFQLSFLGGKAAFWAGSGPLAHLQEYDMTGWTYGLNMNMDLYTLEQKDINNKITVPELVSNQLNHFIDNLFTVNSLFLDFESTNLLNFNPSQTSAGNSGDVGEQQFVLFMQFYLQNLVKAGNPYVLGYAINTTDTSKVPQDQNVPDTLKFTGTDYTMYNDPVSPGLSNLNFTLVTKGGFGHVSGSPGTFDTNWITPNEQCSAKMIIAHQDLLEALLIEPLYNTLQQNVFEQITGKVDVTAGNSYAQARSNTASGLHYSISDITTGDDQYQNYFDVTFNNLDKSTNVVINGYIHVRKQVHHNDGFCQAEAWSEGDINWSTTISITTTKDQNGNPMLQVSQSPVSLTPKTSSDQNTCAKAFEWIGRIVGAILDIFTLGLDGGFFSNLFAKIFTAQIPGIGNVGAAFQNLSNSISNAVLLPAGQVFFFKNPSFDTEGNFYLELTYISNQ